MIRILVADDHPIVRKGIKELIAETTDLKVVDETGDGQEALSKAWKNNYDVVLLDIALPGRNGLDILRQLNARKPKLRVLMLSMHREEEYALRALKAGACGYLTKESLLTELIAAIRVVARGRKYISPTVAEKLALELRGEHDKPPHERLSDREYEVMLLIASGKTPKQIGEELCLSPKTITTYRARILEKMRLTCNADLTRYVIENRLAP
ncbi:MAG: response regulator transcription factor [Elusimicrobiota bacterium]